MPGATVSVVQSLDELYIDFARRTSHVFDQFPQIEPARHSIFKELLCQGISVGWKDSLKHWLRPMLRRGHSRGRFEAVDVLIFAESTREVILDALLPVYNELKSQQVNARIVSFNGPDKMPPSTIEFNFPASAVPPSWTKPAWEALCEKFNELKGASQKKAFSYHCANIKGLLDECDSVLDRLKPRVVIVASTQIVGGSAMMVTARERGISTFILQHGILQPFYIPILADRMITWGDSSNQTLERLGISREQMVPLGSPRHDSMSASIAAEARKKLLAALNLADKPTFAFFSNGNDLVRNGIAPVECANWLEDAAARFSKEINIVVKLHPNEDGSLYRDSHHLCVTKEATDLATILAGCDWVGSLCSTVLYDALIYKKPVWQFYSDPWPELADNWKYGLARRISSRSELIKMIDETLIEGVDQLVDERVCEQVFANHGRATQVVADFVAQQLA